MAVEIQKSLCGVRKTENLIESTCFYLKSSQFHAFYLKTSIFHVFCSNFNPVRMFYDEYHSRLAPESTRPRSSPSQKIVDNLTKNSKAKIYY